jgi:hypothetical protein
MPVVMLLLDDHTHSCAQPLQAKTPHANAARVRGRLLANQLAGFRAQAFVGGARLTEATDEVVCALPALWTWNPLPSLPEPSDPARVVTRIVNRSVSVGSRLSPLVQ